MSPDDKKHLMQIANGIEKLAVQLKEVAQVCVDLNDRLSTLEKNVSNLCNK